MRQRKQVSITKGWHHFPFGYKNMILPADIAIQHCRENKIEYKIDHIENIMEIE